MDAELAAKAAAKYDPALEAKAAQWIQGVTGVSFNATPFGDMLKDGTVLCELVNAILAPGDRLIGVVLLCAHPLPALYVGKWAFM